MNLNYAIFRSEPIYTLQDLAQIGSHNKREKQAYKSNPDIKLELKNNNIELVPLADKYFKGFYNITKEYRKEHDERMKTEREDRKKTFNQMLNKSKNVVADELLFTATHTFFKNMEENDIKEWANTCMQFVYKDLGYNKSQVLHATIHMDEETPHLHCVVVPLIKKFDKRTNTEKYTISKKHYMKSGEYISELQDKYWKRMNDNGFKLERGIKNSDNEHISIKEFKKLTRKLDARMEKQNHLMTRDYEILEEKLKTSKPTLTGKKVKIDKETYDTLKDFMNTSKRVIKDMPNNQALFEELNDYTNHYREMEQKNRHLEVEIRRLEDKNDELRDENRRLHNFLNVMLQTIKKFFRKLLHIGSEKDKDNVVEEITSYHGLGYYNDRDLYDIADGTPREEEINNYIYEQNYDYNKDYDDKDIDI